MGNRPGSAHLVCLVTIAVLAKRKITAMSLRWSSGPGEAYLTARPFEMS